MDQSKVGGFIKELRKEKNLTQEQFAETFCVSRRTVSRWETGSNLPDLDILIEMSDYFEIELREILDGERKSEKMNEELKETVLKVAEYSNDEKKKQAKIVLVYFILGIVCMIAHIVFDLVELPSTFWVGLLEGMTLGMGLAALLLGLLFITGVWSKIKAFKLRLIGRGDKYEVR